MTGVATEKPNKKINLSTPHVDQCMRPLEDPPWPWTFTVDLQIWNFYLLVLWHSQDSVATRLRWGGIFNDRFIANFLENAIVKAFWKSASRLRCRLRWLTFWPTLYITSDYSNLIRSIVNRFRDIVGFLRRQHFSIPRSCSYGYQR